MHSRLLPARAPLTILLLAVSVVFLLLGLRTFLWPGSAAAFYGAPSDTSEALVFVKAYGARNIAISLLAMALLYLDAGLGMAVLLACAALIAMLDAIIMHGYAGFSGAFKHLLYTAVLGGLAILTAAIVLARRDRSLP